MYESNLGEFEPFCALTLKARLVDKAATGLPEIEKRIVSMTEQIEQCVRTNQDQLMAAA